MPTPEQLKTAAYARAEGRSVSDAAKLAHVNVSSVRRWEAAGLLAEDAPPTTTLEDCLVVLLDPSLSHTDRAKYLAIKRAAEADEKRNAILAGELNGGSGIVNVSFSPATDTPTDTQLSDAYAHGYADGAKAGTAGGAGLAAAWAARQGADVHPSETRGDDQ